MEQPVNQSLKVLLATAEAYYERGSYIQYDQLSMDRIWRITPRRDLFAVPEEATAQHTLFLDCSSFVFSCFWQTFGYAFKADLTHDMVHLSDIRVFDYRISGQETEDERQKVLAQFHDTLCPGDIIVYVYAENGHTMLYLGGEELLHCSTYGKPCSYDYEAQHENIYQESGIKRASLSEVLSADDPKVPNRNYLFTPNRMRFCILRPMAQVGPATESAMLRLAGMKHIQAEALCSHPEGRTVQAGDMIIYTVRITNMDTVPREIMLRFGAPLGTSAQFAEEECSYVLTPGEMRSEAFPVAVVKTSHDTGIFILSPEIHVNRLSVPCQPVLQGKNLNPAQVATLFEAMAASPCVDTDGASMVAKSYQSIGITLPFSSAKQAAEALFRAEDGTNERVLRLAECHSDVADMLVPHQFGGLGVITPTLVSQRELRTRQIRPSALQAGDLLLCGNDLNGETACLCTYDGYGGFYGRFPDRPGVTRIEPCDGIAFVDSLFGHFFFALLRPSLALGATRQND